MLTLPDLSNKYAVVTGASSGIGKGVTYTLGKHNCNLILLARSEDKLKQIEKDIKEKNDKLKVHVIVTDLSKKESVDNAVNEIKNITNELYLLVNNAGTGSKKDNCLYQQLDDGSRLVDEWEHTINTNLVNLMRLTNGLLPLLLPKDDGNIERALPPTIINICSVAGKLSLSNAESYCASKFGLLGFSNCLFEDIREKGIKVCAICPGLIYTPKIYC
ncbi:hypothetical protein ABK040_007759 [Willaertia magna]